MKKEPEKSSESVRERRVNERKQRAEIFLIAGEGAHEFSERTAKRENFSEVVGSEIGAGFGGGVAFAADLHDADYFGFAQDGSADNFLNGVAGNGGCFNAFEDAGVTHSEKIVVNFGATLASSACGERGSAGERNESDIFKSLRYEEVKMAPAIGDAENGDFVGLDAQIFGDAFGDGRQRDIRGRGRVRFERVGETF
jgi:hypothetical protein